MSEKKSGSEEDLYHFRLDYEDGSAYGVHLKGSGTEKAIEAAIAKVHKNVSYEPVDVGGWDIYPTEEDATKGKNKIGEIRTDEPEPPPPGQPFPRIE